MTTPNRTQKELVMETKVNNDKEVIMTTQNRTPKELVINQLIKELEKQSEIIENGLPEKEEKCEEITSPLPFSFEDVVGDLHHTYGTLDGIGLVIMRLKEIKKEVK